MTTLLPLAPYTASGSGVSADLGRDRAARLTLDVQAFAPSGVGARTVSAETSVDGAAWRTVATFDLVDGVGERSRVVASLGRFLRGAYALGAASVSCLLEAVPTQVYATVADFHVGGLRTGALDDVSDAEKLQALEGASRLIDDYLAARVTLPLVVFANASLRRATVIVATYDLLSFIGYNPEGDSDNFRLRYLDVLAWLEDVRDGKAPLPAGLEDSTPNASEGAPEVYSDCPRGW